MRNDMFTHLDVTWLMCVILSACDFVFELFASLLQISTSSFKPRYLATPKFIGELHENSLVAFCVMATQNSVTVT